MECDYSQPESVVRCFITEMAQWEFEATQESARETDVEAFWSKIKASMNEVFARYCTPKERPYGRNGTYSPRANNEVTINIVDVIEESSRRCAVTIEQSYILLLDDGEQHQTHEKDRYILLKKGGKWLIDNRKKYSSHGELFPYFL